MGRLRTVWRRLLVVVACMYCLIFVISNHSALKFYINRTVQVGDVAKF